MIMGFVFAHMVGNLKMYLGPEDFDHYGEFLRELLVPFLPRTVTLWLLRLGLIAAFALHIHAAYSLTIMNRQARTTKYQSKRDYVAANYASRTMRWSGVIVGLFLVWHLFDLTFTGTGYHYVRGHAVRATWPSRWAARWNALLYLVANLALGLPPLPRRLVALPDHGLEQPPLQRLAPGLRRRLRRHHRARQRLVPARRHRRHRLDLTEDGSTHDPHPRLQDPRRPRRREVDEVQVRPEAGEPGQPAQVRHHRRRHRPGRRARPRPPSASRATT